MNSLLRRWSAYLDQQHRCPTGLIGQVIGERMLRQHEPETNWSIELLQLEPTDRILEIGFGAGRGLEIALERSPQGHVTGVDLSTTMIEVAARRNRSARKRGYLSLLRGDGATLPFHGPHFDKIVSIHTFYFWPDPHALMLQILPLLAVQGRFVTTFATAHTSQTGERSYWPLHNRAKAIVQALQEEVGIEASLRSGPDSRHFNNVAILMKKVESDAH